MLERFQLDAESRQRAKEKKISDLRTAARQCIFNQIR